MTTEEWCCPNCGAPELNAETGLLNIRGYKVHMQGHWWSNCLACEASTGGTHTMWFTDSGKTVWEELKEVRML